MKKKLVIMVAALALVVVLVFTGCAEGVSELYIEDQKALAGDNVDIPIYIKSNPGICLGNIIINYDPDALEFVSCTNGEVFDACMSHGEGGVASLLLEQTKLESTDGEGLVATITFKVRSAASKGDVKISFDKESNFSDELGNKVTLEKMSDGVVTVK